MWHNFQSLQIPHNPPTQSRRRYSVTADILAYQQCSIQYGAFAARRYEPALVVQLFYGTVIHQVLDRAHAHFRGELGVPAGSPTVAPTLTTCNACDLRWNCAAAATFNGRPYLMLYP